MADLDRVGFTHKGREYTEDAPCVFNDFCSPADADRWAKHTGDWLNAVRKRATTPERMQQWEGLARRYAAALESSDNCNVLTCTSSTRALVSMAQLLKALADSWGAPVEEDEVLTDWGWIDALQLPIIPGLEELKQKVKDKIQAHFIGKYAPFALLALLLLWDDDK